LRSFRISDSGRVGSHSRVLRSSTSSSLDILELLQLVEQGFLDEPVHLQPPGFTEPLDGLLDARVDARCQLDLAHGHLLRKLA
jgi:hypothetical protein